MKYLGILQNKYKKYSVFKDRTGLYYLNNNEVHILSEKEYKEFLKIEKLKLLPVRN